MNRRHLLGALIVVVAAFAWLRWSDTTSPTREEQRVEDEDEDEAAAPATPEEKASLEAMYPQTLAMLEKSGLLIKLDVVGERAEARLNSGKWEMLTADNKQLVAGALYWKAGEKPVDLLDSNGKSLGQIGPQGLKSK